MSRDEHSGVSDQGKAAEHRRRDAQALYEAGRFRDCVYLGGYAIECLLKQRLMLRFGCVHLGELDDELRRRGLLPSHLTVFTHQLSLLLELADPSGRIRKDGTAWPAFVLVNRWVPAWRYNPREPGSEEAEAFLGSVDAASHWIRANL
jgi:HEPN domain-containing protein